MTINGTLIHSLPRIAQALLDAFQGGAVSSLVGEKSGSGGVAAPQATGREKAAKELVETFRKAPRHEIAMVDVERMLSDGDLRVAYGALKAKGIISERTEPGLPPHQIAVYMGE